MRVTSSTTIALAVGTAVGGMVMVLIGAFCWVRRCNNKPDFDGDGEREAMRPSRINGPLGGGLRTPQRYRNGNRQGQGLSTEQPFRYEEVSGIGDGNVPNLDLVIPSSDSMISQQSRISTGSSVDGDSGDEYDETQILADEFEKYKDQNLEKMRSKLEGNVSNFDIMMSQALTMALMEEEDEMSSISGSIAIGDKTSIELEADLLCEMNDWLKRTEGASVDERREFMQESLNKMVAIVHQGGISPEDASRAIHGCAAMLGLQLAEDIPETTLIVTGMRFSVTKEDVRDAFKKFGEIENAAISSNKRGFGIVRFTSKKSAHRALGAFKTEEIVVQDVAVSVRLLKADMPEIEVRRVYSNERRSR